MMEFTAAKVRLRMITKREALRTMEPLDQTDRKILNLLQTDGRLSGAEVGRRVGLSQPAASARIVRLERQGVITGYRATVDPAAIGLNIHAVVRLRTTSTLRVTGEDCLVLDVHCSDAGRLEQVVDSLARFGPVSTALVLRDYPYRPLTPHPEPEA
jgi:Lrp/AsnC family leucine-responsive transcriptional regulator